MSKERELLKKSLDWMTSVYKNYKPGESFDSKFDIVDLFKEIDKTLSQQDRKEVLLKATYDLLKECDKGIYVKNALETVVFYDDAECDGFCLMEDIAAELDIYE